MNKSILLGFSALLSLSAYADSLKILSTTNEFPTIYEPQLQALGLSPDGKYACGSVTWGAGVFVADLESGQVKWEQAMNDDGGELRHVDNSGVGIGIEYTYLFDSGTLIMNEIPEGFRSVIYEDLTADGKLIVGSLGLATQDTQAAYYTEADGWKLLPIPADEELFGYAPRLRGSSAKFVSEDGSVILGFLGSFGIPILWYRNDAGEYEYDFFTSRFSKYTQDDLADENKPLWGMSAQYFNLSENGQYVCMLGMVLDEQQAERYVSVVYDTVKKEAIVYPYEQEIDTTESGLYPSSISNDGTLIGCVGKPYFASTGSFIIKAGETQAELFNDAFPAYNELLGESDDLGFSIPTAISADGKKILGYTYYAEDYYDEEHPAYYLSYVIYTGDDNAVEEVSSSADARPEAIYSIDGHKLKGMTKGLNIIRNSDGSVTKLLKK